MSGIDKIHQCIAIGSPIESIMKGLITISDVLVYLLTENISEKSMIAYKAVCELDRLQLISINGSEKPFILITEHDEYVGIYNLMIKEKEIQGRTEQENKDMILKTQHVWSKLLYLNNFNRNIYMICDVEKFNIIITPDERWLIVGSRSTNYMLKFYSEILKEPEIWIDNEYLEPLHQYHSSSFIDILIKRCKYLKYEADIYWNKIAKNMYFGIVENKFLRNMNITKKQLEPLVEIFGDMISSDITEMPDLIFNLKNLHMVDQAYVLGFPIHKHIPSQEVINNAIEKLNDIGIDLYADMIEKFNKDSLNLIINPICNKNIPLANDEDALKENIFCYNNFDLVYNYTETHLYIFTRPEFKTLVEQNKNIWTNEPLKINVLNTVYSKIELARDFGLPSPATIKDLLIKVESGTLFIESEDSESDSEDEEVEIQVLDEMDQHVGNLVLINNPSHMNDRDHFVCIHCAETISDFDSEYYE